jgi:hypothetical protein
MKKKSEELQAEEVGTSYFLYKYRVVDGKGIEKVISLVPDEDPTRMSDRPDAYQKITFVRGDKNDNGTIIPRVDGILHEQLLGMMIVDLEYKNTLVPNEFTEVAIMNLKSALKQLEFRQQDRELRNVVGTYQK